MKAQNLNFDAGRLVEEARSIIGIIVNDSRDDGEFSSHPKTVNLATSAAITLLGIALNEVYGKKNRTEFIGSVRQGIGVLKLLCNDIEDNEFRTPMSDIFMAYAAVEVLLDNALDFKDGDGGSL